MDSNERPSESTPNADVTSNNNFLISWKTFKARENFRLELQMEALKKSLEEQMRSATVLNMIELPPENMDEEEIFNERLEYREGALAGNYGRASKEAIEKFYGESKPVFKYAQIPPNKIKKQVMQKEPELYVMSDEDGAAAVQETESSGEVVTQVILLDEASSTVGVSDVTDSMFQLPNDTLMVFPDSNPLPDLMTMETEVELAEIDLVDFDLDF